MEAHVALVTLAEIGAGVLGPLVRLGQQHPVGEMLVQIGTDGLQDVMRLGQVLVVGAVAFDQIGDRIQAQPVHAHLQPHAHDLENLGQHLGVVEVQVGLVRIEPVPVIGARDRIPGPVRLFRVQKDNPGFGPFFVRVGPDIEVARRRSGLGMAGLLEPRMLVAGVVDDQFGDHADAAPMRLGHEGLEVAHRAIGRIDRPIVGDVIAVVAQGRGIEGQQPDGRHA